MVFQSLYNILREKYFENNTNILTDITTDVKIDFYIKYQKLNI